MIAVNRRHADRLEVLRAAVFESEGCTERATRAAAAGGHGQLPPGVGAYLAKVREESYRITDEDLAALKEAGRDEEEIFELTVAAAVGAARHRLECGLRAMGGDD